MYNTYKICWEQINEPSPRTREIQTTARCALPKTSIRQRIEINETNMQQHVKILKVYLLATASVQTAEIQKVSKEKLYFILLKNNKFLQFPQQLHF